MTTTRAVVVTALATAVLVLGGCFSPWLKRASGTPPQKPSPVLVAGFVVHFDDNGEKKSLLEAATDVAQNAGLDELGKKATGLLADALASRGYTASYDGARARKLDAVEISSNAGTAALTGQWRHPDASYWTPQQVDSLFVKPADIVGKLRVEGQKEYFAFADISIADAGILFKDPVVIVRTAVYDQDANKVLDLGGLGEGKSGLFISDRSPQNLEAALQRAFDSVTAAAEQPI